MKIRINSFYNGNKLVYSLYIEESHLKMQDAFYYDTWMVKKLKLSIKKYKKILNKFNCSGIYHTSISFFENKLDAENALKYLEEKYLIMAILAK